MLLNFSRPPLAFTFLSSVISLPNAALERNSTLEKFNSRFFRFSCSTSLNSSVPEFLDVRFVQNLSVDEAHHGHFAHLRDFNSPVSGHGKNPLNSNSSNRADCAGCVEP